METERKEYDFSSFVDAFGDLSLIRDIDGRDLSTLTKARQEYDDAAAMV